MPRNLDPTFASALGTGNIAPVILVVLTFLSQTCYAWSGVGNLLFNGNTYLGVGSLGKIGAITEGVEVRADGSSVTLSGIDPIYLAESLTDIQLGATAQIWFGLFSNQTGSLVGQPYMVFGGCVDKPTVSPGRDTFTITIALENKLIDLQRLNMRRYTSADQRLQYPDDTAFGWVEQLVDQALIWG